MSSPRPSGAGRRAPSAPPARERRPDPELVALVHAARAGDDRAWARLVERFDRRLRAIARFYRLAPSDIDDVVQVTWLRLFKHIDGLQDPAAIAGWLATTTRRESLRLLQRCPVREQPTDDPRLGDGPDTADPESELFAAERRDILAKALATLPDRQRRLLTLLAAEPAPDYRRIGALLPMPVGSIGPIRARSLARLRRSPELRAMHADMSD